MSGGAERETDERRRPASGTVPRMDAYEHIACLVDDSQPALAGARVAARLATLLGAKLTLVHVAPSAESFVGGTTPWTDDMADVDSQLRKQASEWLAHLSHEVGAEAVVLQGGHPGEIACLWAEEAGCDLVVVTPQRGRLARMALGSVAGYVAANASANVLVARGEAIADQDD